MNRCRHCYPGISNYGVIHKECPHKFGNFWDPPSLCPGLSTFGWSSNMVAMIFPSGHPHLTNHPLPLSAFVHFCLTPSPPKCVDILYGWPLWTKFQIASRSSDGYSFVEISREWKFDTFTLTTISKTSSNWRGIFKLFYMWIVIKD